MKILGINCLNHDAALSLIEDGEIIFAAHSERYSRIKNDKKLNDSIFEEALSYGLPDKIVYYERPLLKKTRQVFSGQYASAFSLDNLPSKYLRKWINRQKIIYVDHHKSHAAAGYYTSRFDEAAVVVIDGIGEWDVLTLWHGRGKKLKKIYSVKYPNSLGLFYSAMTQRINLKPCEEEYILMGMSAWGSPVVYEEILRDFFSHKDVLHLNRNIHRGIGPYKTDIKDFDIASSTQKATEYILDRVFKHSKELLPGVANLVYMGGVALNCVANTEVVSKLYDNIWIMPNPGDAGSSLGCAAAVYGDKLNWQGPFLGTEIKGSYPVSKSLEALLKGDIIGIANGRAEFGPRALGNRSLLADPRGPGIKDRVNEIKRRQKFRPFAPAILESQSEKVFEMPVKKIPYMQFIATCKRPDLYPAISHVDNTSRVQTVSEADNKGFYDLINEFYRKTGCPMLLNTSLNIKGQPIVNDENDAREFENHYGIKVFTSE